MMLRMARRYDVQSDSILFANNQPYTRDSYSLAGMGETVDDLLRFCRQMYAMKVDNAEYALLTAIVIFSGMLNEDFLNVCVDVGKFGLYMAKPNINSTFT